MDEETRAELAALRSEIDALRMELAEAGREMAGGEGADVGLPLVPIGGGDALPGAFEPVHDATTGLLTGFRHCIYCAERQFVECGTDGEMEISGVTASTSGYVVLALPHNAYVSASGDVIDNDNVSIAIENELPMNTSDSVTKISLYHVTAGVVDVDLRAVPTGVLAR